MEENKFRRRGHRAIMSPIAHPELAGNSIENTRGAFQRCTTGERTNKTDLRRVSTPSSNAFVIRWRSESGYDCFHGLEQKYKFARRARDHARIYRGEYSVASIIDIERIRKKKKSHRGALDQATCRSFPFRMNILNVRSERPSFMFSVQGKSRCLLFFFFFPTFLLFFSFSPFLSAVFQLASSSLLPRAEVLIHINLYHSKHFSES